MNIDWLLEKTGIEKHKWEECCSALEHGSEADLANMKEEFPEILAEELESGGLKEQNPKLLWQAAELYRRVNELKKAAKCRVAALELREEWEKAGRLHESEPLSDLEKAAYCYWNACSWNNLRRMVERIIKPEEEYRIISTFMTNNSTIKEIRELNAYMSGKCRDPLWELDENSAQWKQVFALLRKTAANEPGKELLYDAGKVFSIFGKAGFPGGYDEASNCFFRGGYYEEALYHWEIIGKTGHTDYFLSKSEIAGISSERFRWLNLAQKYDDIIKEAMNMEDKDCETIIQIAEAYRRRNAEGDMLSAFQSSLEMSDTMKARCDFNYCMAKSLLTPDDKIDCLRRLIYAILKNDDIGKIDTWMEVVNIFDDTIKKSRNHEKEIFSVRCHIVREFGRSNVAVSHMDISENLVSKKEENKVEKVNKIIDRKRRDWRLPDQIREYPGILEEFFCRGAIQMAETDSHRFSRLNRTELTLLRIVNFPFRNSVTEKVPETTSATERNFTFMSQLGKRVCLIQKLNCSGLQQMPLQKMRKERWKRCFDEELHRFILICQLEIDIVEFGKSLRSTSGFLSELKLFLPQELCLLK